MAAKTDSIEGRLNPRRVFALRILLIGAFVISAYLAWAASGSGGVAGCGPESGCDKVMHSRWSSWFGIPVSFPALAVYAAALTATWFLRRAASVPRQRLAWHALVPCAVAILGAVLWFVVLQVMVIKAICPYCMTAHGLGAVAAGLILFMAPLGDPQDKPWKVDKVVFLRPTVARNLALVAGAGVAVLVAGQVVYRPQTFAVSALNLPAPTNAAAPVAAPRWLLLYGGAIQLNLQEVPLLGSPEAPVVVVGLHDYGCHHCRIMHGHLAQVRREFSNQLAIVSLPMPLNPNCNSTVKRTHPDHVHSCEYARMGLAVWRSNRQAMEQFDDWIFTPERPPPLAQVQGFAEQLVGSNAFHKALQDPWIDRQMQQGVSIYATNYVHFKQGSMPQLIIGSNVVVGALGSATDLYPLLAKQPGMRKGP